MNIYIHNHTNAKILYLKKILLLIFIPLIKNKILHIIFISNKQMKKMNKYYRKKNCTTDVLSFVNVIEGDNSLGDIFISFPKAKEQALKYGHSLEREIAFLALHGYFHLKGYNDDTDEELKIMLSLQEKILIQHNLIR
ncbi:MAG: rRNA maturation RNase YbeY [Vigna little leaf phytoplasma]|nr:rRNA maturation RNase YbeY [Vigna little leaf phytoplasma]